MMVYRVGYGKATVENNIKVLMRTNGLDYDQARVAALKVARGVFFKKNPNRPLPPYLEEQGVIR